MIENWPAWPEQETLGIFTKTKITVFLKAWFFFVLWYESSLTSFKTSKRFILQQDWMFWFVKAIPDWPWSNWGILTKSINLGYIQWNMFKILLALTDTNVGLNAAVLGIYKGNKNLYVPFKKLESIVLLVLLLFSMFKIFLDGLVIKASFLKNLAYADITRSFSVF